MFQDIQPVIKKETKRVAVMTGIGVVAMWVLFLILHLVLPDKVPFDYTVILGGLFGGLVAVGNFFFMGIAVQKAAAETSEDAARTRIKASYSQRMMLQMLWAILAIVLPCFQFVAGLVPLLFPSFGIKLTGLLGKQKQADSQ